MDAVANEFDVVQPNVEDGTQEEDEALPLSLEERGMCRLLQCAMRCYLARRLVSRQRLRSINGTVAQELLLAKAHAWFHDAARAMLLTWHLSASKEAVSDRNNIMSMQTEREIVLLKFGKHLACTG